MLDDIIELFQSVDGHTRLEVLLEYADRLPALPAKYETVRDAGLHMVHECQSPVFLVVEVQDGTVHLFADVPREAPTARGFTSLLIDAFDGVSVDAVRQAPADVLHPLGLRQLLGMQRTRGLSAIYHRIKAAVS